MLVFAFDRDWTVDVNPHPRHDAVPLEWVRHLAHETEHAVYAIGNQDLAEEAAIPGVVDIVGRHPDDWDEWLGGKLPTGRYERFPQRRERLALIEDLHPDADRYIVVDDLDLSDVEGWDHFHAWEFVPEVEAGTIDPTLPWATGETSDDDPITDGGLPKPAGIMPVDVADLTSFLDEYGDRPGFEVNYEDDGEDVSRLCWDITVIDETVDGDGDGEEPSIRCSAVLPDAEGFTLAFDALDIVHSVRLSPAVITRRAETMPDRAAGLRRLAEAAPRRLGVSPVLTLIDQENPTTQQRQDALRALGAYAAVEPVECTPAIPIVRSLLQDSGLETAEDALLTLRVIGEDCPEDIAVATDDIVPYLDAEEPAVRREAAGCLAAIAREYPDDVVDAVPRLVDLLGEDRKQQRYAVFALERVSDEFPDAVEPAAGTPADIVADRSANDQVRLGATTALGRAIGASPDIALDVFEDVVTVYDADHYKLRNNAVALTFEVAALHTDIVEPHVEAIGDLLTVDDDRTRINASGTLARVAEDFPGSVEPVTPTLIELLSDDHQQVRENACWALGYLQTPTAVSTLEDRLREEPDEDVRNRVAWALSEIE